MAASSLNETPNLMSPSEQAPESHYRVTGTLAEDYGKLVGWCWSPDRPNERLRVALHVDGTLLGATVAARFHPDLVRDGLCDGYHGFSYSLPSPMPAFSMIEAIEWNSGRVFGRIVASEMAMVRDWVARIDRISSDIDGMHDRLTKVPPFTPLSIGFAHAGMLLSRVAGNRPSFPAAKAEAVRLPTVTTPALSVILDASHNQQVVLAALRVFAQLVRHFNIECVVADSGCGYLSAALATSVGASFCLTAETNAAVRANQAAKHARSSILAFFDASAVCLAGALELLNFAKRSSPVLVGGAVTQVARRAGIGAFCPVAPGVALASGLLLLITRENLLELGGFEPAFDDGCHLPALALALHAMAAGTEVLAWCDVAPAARQPPPYAAAARRSFAAWCESARNVAT